MFRHGILGERKFGRPCRGLAEEDSQVHVYEAVCYVEITLDMYFDMHAIHES